MAFEQFKEYIVEEGKKGSKHSFYKVDSFDIIDVEKKILLPKELKDFYLNVGYGLFFDSPDSYAIDKFYSPTEYCKINLRQDYYSHDPTLDLYKSEKFKDYFIFFEVVEGNYLLIDRKEINGKNAIFYIDEKIADSLEEFLVKFDKEGHYFE